jgi:hypothetical protein
MNLIAAHVNGYFSLIFQKKQVWKIILACSNNGSGQQT